jgi:beta-glucosidase
MAEYSPGDITNWMDADTGDFNYTGLEENMKIKAGMFYGMSRCPKPGSTITNDLES